MRTLSLGCLICLAACGSARAGVPLAGPLTLDSNAQHGQIVYMRHCQQCHPGGEAGVGPAINNKSIPAPVMKLQIRQGVLGTMPKFSDAVLADQDIDRILDYLAVLGEHHR